MHCTCEISRDLIYIGANDRRLALFESVYPIPQGVSYNAYLLRGEKTALLDTVDKAVSEQFLENLTYALAGRKLDYIVVNHMEPDHAGHTAAGGADAPRGHADCKQAHSGHDPAVF